MSTQRTELKTWKFTLDQTKYGEGAGWARPEYDDSRWIEVDTYTAWETLEYAMADYEGCGWFRTRVSATKAAKKRHVLKFDGIGGMAKVFVNGRYVGGTDNRYLPFEIDISNELKSEGESLIAVLVDNSFRGKAHIPGGAKVEWVLYGGLTHKIYLEEQPATYISHVRADAQADGNLKVTVEIHDRLPRTYIPDFVGTVQVSVAGLPELTMEQEVKPECNKKIQLVFEAKAEDVKTWSPDEPNLYDLQVVLTEKGQPLYTVNDRIGFRTIAVEGTKILLNGKEIYLKGANRYDENAPYGNCPPPEKIREDLLEMKRCGLNLVRTHYPQDEIHYKIADEVGIMYMIEVPLNWWFPKDTETFADFCGLVAEAVDSLDRTFQNFCNHPCWTVWSVGNECFHSHPAVNQTFRMLAERMRALNPGRLITYAANKPLLNSQELDFVDFLGMNAYSGILSDHAGQFPEQMEAVLEKKMRTAMEYYPDKPHVMTEYGYVCVYGIHGSLTEGRFTEDFGSTFMKADLAEYMKNPNMRGMVIWCWADYRHRRGFSGGGMHLSATYGPYGIVTMDRKPKQLLFDVLQDFYTNWNPQE